MEQVSWRSSRISSAVLTYRAVYTVKFAGVVYALHAFQKKAKHGIATPKQEIDLVRRRLRIAEHDDRERSKERKEDAKE